MTKNKRIGLTWIIAPIGLLVCLLLISTFVNLIFPNSPRTISLRIFEAITGFLGTVFTVFIIIGIIIGIIFLIKKESLENAAYDERSGKGKNSEIPPEIKGWSWGAAFLTWIWGVSNGVWISFLSFIPVINLFWWIVLGIKGKEWAWQAQKWQSMERFKQTQRKWDKVGLVIFFINLILLIVSFVSIIHNPQPYNYQTTINPIVNQSPLSINTNNQQQTAENIPDGQSKKITLNLNSSTVDNENELKLTLIKVNDASADVEINYANKDTYQGLRWDPRQDTVNLTQDFYSKIYEGSNLIDAAKKVYRDHLFCNKTPQLYSAENFNPKAQVSESDFIKNWVGKPYNEILELAGGYGFFNCTDRFDYQCGNTNNKGTYYIEHCDFGVIRFKEGEIKNGPPFNIRLSKILNDRSVEVELIK